MPKDVRCTVCGQSFGSDTVNAMGRLEEHMRAAHPEAFACIQQRVDKFVRRKKIRRNK